MIPGIEFTFLNLNYLFVMYIYKMIGENSDLGNVVENEIPNMNIRSDTTITEAEELGSITSYQQKSNYDEERAEDALNIKKSFLSSLSTEYLPAEHQQQYYDYENSNAGYDDLIHTQNMESWDNSEYNEVTDNTHRLNMMHSSINAFQTDLGGSGGDQKSKQYANNTGQNVAPQSRHARRIYVGGTYLILYSQQSYNYNICQVSMQVMLTKNLYEYF